MNKKNIVWILLLIGVISLAFKNKKRKGSLIIPPLDKGEFPNADGKTFASDVPDYQD
jgi:hypothetical protein